MEKSPEYVDRFQDLRIYKKQRELSREVFTVTRGFPKDERYSLTDQIRRSSRSIGAQIAEAWGKRLYPKSFVSKLSDADGEQLETQHWLLIASDAGYLDTSTYERLNLMYESIGRMLGRMMAKADSFTGSDHLLKEGEIPYLAEEAE